MSLTVTLSMVWIFTLEKCPNSTKTIKVSLLMSSFLIFCCTFSFFNFLTSASKFLLWFLGQEISSLLLDRSLRVFLISFLRASFMMRLCCWSSFICCWNWRTFITWKFNFLSVWTICLCWQVLCSNFLISLLNLHNFVVEFDLSWLREKYSKLMSCNIISLGTSSNAM